jgi:hypothetical protein
MRHFCFQPLLFSLGVSGYIDVLRNFVLQSIALVLEGESLDVVLFPTSLSVVLSLFEFSLLMQKSGEFVVLVGLNAENEIIHSLAFGAGYTLLYQVSMFFLLLTPENK